MWICLNDAFLSAVQDFHRPDVLMIRSRKREHLRRVFPDAEILTIPTRDYAFRVFVTKAEFIDVMTRQVDGIDYPNFKASVRDKGLHDLYLDFWSLHREYQDG